MNTSNIDLSPANNVILSLVDSLKGFFGENIKNIFVVASIFLIFWLLRFSIRVLRAFQSHLKDDSLDLI